MIRAFFVFLFSMMAICSVAQKSKLSNLLWEEAGGRIDTSQNHGGEYEITDDSANGYLKVAFTEDGCGCYFETIVGAYKDKKGGYTTLKSYWNGCGWSKTLSSNHELESILPGDFGLRTFLPKSLKEEYRASSAVFYLEAKVPRKGTDTQVDLTYIPFGLHVAKKEDILAHGYKQINDYDSGKTNFIYSGALQSMLLKLSDVNTLECILERSPDDIIPEDKNIVEKLYGEGADYKDIDELATQIQRLKTIYEISRDIEYKSVILGWDRDKARFFIKEKIKNGTSKMSLLEFVRQLPFLLAIC